MYYCTFIFLIDVTFSYIFLYATYFDYLWTHESSEMCAL